MSKNNTPEPVHALVVLKHRGRALQVLSTLFISAGAERQREGERGFYNPSIMLLRDVVSHFICHGLMRHGACLGLLVIAASVKRGFMRLTQECGRGGKKKRKRKIIKNMGK